MSAQRFAALILAGSRDERDPVATSEGVPHKALVDIAGDPMLARVARAVAEAGAARVAVSTSDPAVRAVALTMGLTVIDADTGPSASVAKALDVLGTPLLVTTADHGLLDPAWVIAFVQGVPAGVDVAAFLAERKLVEVSAPGSKRTWLRFADGDWSGCNLFWLATPRARGAIALWRQVEADRKRPWRIVRRLGLRRLARYLAGRLTLQEGLAALGRTADIEAAVVASPFGLAAVDVDTPEDLRFVRAIAAL